MLNEHMLQPHSMVTLVMQECLNHGWSIADKIIGCILLRVIVNNLTAYFAGTTCRHILQAYFANVQSDSFYSTQIAKHTQAHQSLCHAMSVHNEKGKQNLSLRSKGITSRDSDSLLRQ